MYNTLQEIKEQLFDAPSEVKEAFNTVVGYFDTEYFGKYDNRADKFYLVYQTKLPGKHGNGSIDNFRVKIDIPEYHVNSGLKCLGIYNENDSFNLVHHGKAGGVQRSKGKGKYAG